MMVTNKLTRFMNLNRMSLRAVAEKTGLDPAYLCRVLNGQSIGERTIARLAIGLKITKAEAYRQIEEARNKRRKKTGGIPCN
jgi:transcriptional regulator with XRE-family HTH domain